MKSKEEYRERLFKGYERSGLSQEEFCREQDIPIAQFKYQWRKRITPGSIICHCNVTYHKEYDRIPQGAMQNITLLIGYN